MPENGVNDGRDVIYIPDEEGNEEPFEILFTFERDDTGEKYMLVVPEGEADSEEEEVYAFRYEEDEEDNLTLYLIEDESEWDMVEETFNTLVGGGQDGDRGEDV